MPSHLGKLPRQTLERVVLQRLGFKRRDVLLGPRFGEDAALLKVDGKIVAASSDPITGAMRRVGWLAVHANANDIATRGVRPMWFLSNILLPQNTSENVIKTICTEIHRACEQLRVAIIGGHCEHVATLTQPIVVGCMLGAAEGKRVVSCGNAKAGDELILTKAAGIEGTAILASSFRRMLQQKFGSAFVAAAARYHRQVSVVEDALTAFDAGEVHAMHDPTEGGVAGGLHELAEAAGVGFIVEEKRVPIHRETRRMCKFFNINPLNLISSGALLIACPSKSAKKILRAHVHRGIPSAPIGKLVDASAKRLIKSSGEEVELPYPQTDELWRVLSEFQKR